jgi:hypothetical protein
MKLTDKQRRAMFARIGRTSLRENKSVPHVHLLVSPDYERLRKEREEVGVALKVAKDYYGKAIEEAITKYPPMVGGGCAIASDYIRSQHPSCKKEWAYIRCDSWRTPMGHCYLTTPNGLIIDTQIHQFGAITKLPKDHEGYKGSHIYTRLEHEAILPRVKA